MSQWVNAAVGSGTEQKQAVFALWATDCGSGFSKQNKQNKR